MKLFYLILILLSINVQGQIINESFTTDQQILQNRCWMFYGSSIQNNKLIVPPSTAVRTPFMNLEGQFLLKFDYYSEQNFAIFLMDNAFNLILLDFAEAVNDTTTYEKYFNIPGNYAIYIEGFDVVIDNFIIEGIGFNTCIPLAIKIGSPIKKGDFIEFESYSDKGRYVIQRSTDGKNWQNLKIIGAVKGLQKIKLK